VNYWLTIAVGRASFGVIAYHTRRHRALGESQHPEQQAEA
jgi:hypothetical protein